MHGGARGYRFGRWQAMATGVVLGVLAAGAAALAQSSTDPAVPYPAGGRTVYGVRPTGVGLPQLGQSGTVGADALPTLLRTYHDSGSYTRDLATVDGSAQRYIDQRLRAARTPGRQRLTGKPAIVLDIDETSLSNYADLTARNFNSSALAVSAATGHGTAIAPTLRLYKAARTRNVAVFFVTGRPALIDSISKTNLRRAGYDKGWTGLFEKPATAGTAQFKTSTRARLQRRGYDIVANIGDQQSDLDGGHADRDFKLPDPFYFISD